MALQRGPAPRTRLLPGVRRARRFAAGLVALAALVYVGGSAVGEWTTFHPPRRSDGPPPTAYGMAYRPVSFKDAAGLTLRGWWIPGSLNRTVVMVHGWTSSMAEPMSRAAYLHAAGYNLLLFDLRGHGSSDGSYTTMGFVEPQDVHAAVGYALVMAPTAPVALLGYSMGGALVVEAAASDSRVVAVVDDSGYGSLADVIAHRFAQVTHLPSGLDGGLLTIARLDLGFSAAAVRPAAEAALLHRPLLTIIGTADTMVPPAESRTIYDAAPGPKELLVIPGAAHVAGYSVARATYTSTVLGFLRSAFGTA